MTADQQGQDGRRSNSGGGTDQDPILVVLARLDGLRAEGLPVDRIAAEMALVHPVAPGGGPWSTDTVRRVLAIVDSVSGSVPPSPIPTAGPTAADAPLSKPQAPPVSKARRYPVVPVGARSQPTADTRSAPVEQDDLSTPDDLDDPMPLRWGRLSVAALLLAGLGAGGYLGVMALVGDDSSGTSLVGEVVSPTTLDGGATSTTEAPDPADMMSVRVLPAEGELPAARATVRKDGKLYLEGVFASQAQADAFIGRAGEVFGPDNIVESYSVDPAAPAPTVGDIALDKPVLFETGTAVIHPDYIPFLEACAGVLKLNPQIVMSVSAFTDSTGSEEFNLDLSQRRAQAILDFYREQAITEEQLAGQGYGEADPIADNETVEGREQNRRAMLQLLNVMGDEAAALVVDAGDR